jgi:nucleotide-binding universal stress UspA family protein
LAVQVAADLARTIQDLEEVAKARSTARTERGAALFTEVTTVINDALGQGVPEISLLSAIRSSVSTLLSTLHKREPTIFLSYAREDFALVQEVGDRLEAAGIRVWLDKMIQAGTDWIQEIERELSAADFVAFFISPHSVESGWAKQELQIVLHRQVSGEGGAVVLPIILEDADVPPLLRQYQWIDLRDGNVEKGVRQLVDAINHWSTKRSE